MVCQILFYFPLFAGIPEPLEQAPVKELTLYLVILKAFHNIYDRERYFSSILLEDSKISIDDYLLMTVHEEVKCLESIYL